MAGEASTAAAAGGESTGATALSAGEAAATAESIAIPAEWSADTSPLKGYFKEADGRRAFDFESLQRDVSTYHQISTAVPKTADEYQTSYPQDWVMGPEDVRAVKEAAKRVGMTQAQIEAWVNHDLARAERAANEVAADVEKAKQTLGGEWKTDFARNMGLARSVADKFFGPEFAARADVGNNPAVIRGLYQIAKMMGEDTLKTGGAPQPDRPKGEDGRTRLRFPSMGD